MAGPPPSRREVARSGPDGPSSPMLSGAISRCSKCGDSPRISQMREIPGALNAPSTARGVFQNKSTMLLNSISPLAPLRPLISHAHHDARNTGERPRQGDIAPSCPMRAQSEPSAIRDHLSPHLASDIQCGFPLLLRRRMRSSAHEHSAARPYRAAKFFSRKNLASGCITRRHCLCSLAGPRVSSLR